MYQVTIRLFRICIIMAAFGLALNAAPALAHFVSGDPVHDHRHHDAGHHNPPSHEEGHGCSSGYWKKHTEVWFDVCCDESLGQCSDLATALNATGSGGAAIRRAAKEFLDACFTTP